MSRSAQIGGGGSGVGPSLIGYEASGDSEDKLYEVIDIPSDDDDDVEVAEDEHDDAESSSGGGGDWEADEGVMWFKRRGVIGTGEAENHRRAIGGDAAAATEAVEGEKGGKDAAKKESENELEDNRRFWEACLADEYTQFVDCATS
ncbi:zinc finger protein AEBP2-like [Ananas comosus]|uniref:Zinc finger protein AEBP2-like n=1 Tax=Ananas comosus TaxID=4615 RepID=A0A6P5F0F9_ANACO|nr:zinc finger protein AEBP2-like [Ananas comosus]